MNELRFTACNDSDDILESLKPFNSNRPEHAQVQLHWIPWDHQKQELNAIALYGKGGDVSQVGGPLVSDLVTMNALRPFTSREIEVLGGASAFSQVAWSNSRRTADGNVYAVPWIIDPRAIFYWRDLLGNAGVDESTAFISFEQMEETLSKLQAGGVETPWALALSGGFFSVQPACTWIWGAGGDIGNETELLLQRPEGLRGLKKYFSLYRFMPKAIQSLDAAHTYNELFAKRQVAVTMGSLAMLLSIKKSLAPDLQKNLGVALAPGPLFVGSSSLVIWKNTRNEADAVNLVQYMLSDEAQKEYCARAGYLPARLNLLMSPPYSTDPDLKVFTQSVFNGRSLGSFKLSGLFEELLSAAIGRIWTKLYANPDLDLDATILEELMPIARRISLWSESS